MILRPLLLSLVALAAVACSKEPEKAPPPPAEPIAELSAQEVIALEGTPSSTPSFEDETEPPSAKVEGLEGAPGPSPAMGPIDAPVRVYVFTDFQCPVCRRIVEPVKYLARRHPQDVRIVLKHNALASHGRSAAMAAASIAAYRQKKFWGFYDRAFLVDQFDDASILAHAQWFNLDLERFKKDQVDPTVVGQVKYETQLAERFELRSTPGFIVNGQMQMGWGSYGGLGSVVDRELERAKKVAAEGVPAARVAYEATRRAPDKGEPLATALFPPMK
jgi:protein-disulfide isomerase